MAENPCPAIVRVWENAEGKAIRMRLVCPKKDCPDGGQCEKRRSQNDHGGVREWCGCEDQESMDFCHIVIYTIGPGEDPERAGEQKILCAGRCEDDPEAACTPVILREIRLWPSGTVTDVGCECL